MSYSAIAQQPAPCRSSFKDLARLYLLGRRSPGYIHTLALPRIRVAQGGDCSSSRGGKSWERNGGRMAGRSVHGRRQEPQLLRVAASTQVDAQDLLTWTRQALSKRGELSAAAGPRRSQGREESMHARWKKRGGGVKVCTREERLRER